jgi:twinkle protein
LLENQEGERFASCNRCNHYVSPSDYDPKQIKPREKKELTDAEVGEILGEISECPLVELKERKIPQYIAERFGVYSGVSQENGQDIECHFYPKTKRGVLQGYKVRNLSPKYFYSVGRGKESDCFGLPQLLRGDTYRRKLFIFEDELSAMSGYYILDKYKSAAMKQRNMNPSVLALSDGAGSAVACMSRNSNVVNEFEEVILCFDNDRAGEEAVREVMKVFPNIKSVVLPLKDANDMLMEGREKELHNLLLGRAEQPKVEGLIDVVSCLEEALHKPEMGFSYPWEELTKLTFGQRFGEIIAVGGGVGCGKTAMAHEIAAWNWKEHGQKSFMVMLEENNGDTIKNLASKVDHVPYHRPDMEFNKAQLTKTATDMNEYIHLWRSNINQNIRFNFDSIVQAIRYHAVVTGINHVFFDNITAATQHLTPSEINTEVGRIAMTLAGLADELDLQIFIFSHLNTPSSGASHEEGAPVREHQFTGSRALMRWCQQLIGFRRNKAAEGDEKHLSQIELLKNRKFGTTGSLDTIYNPSTNGILQREVVTDEEY